MSQSRNATHAVAAIERISGVGLMLRSLCNVSGMRVAIVAHVSAKAWTVCEVHNELTLPVIRGAPFALRTNLFMEEQASRSLTVVERASLDPRYCSSDRALYHVESYISVPIFPSAAFYFGTLCAFDPQQRDVRAPLALTAFQQTATHVASQLARQYFGEARPASPA